MKPARLFLLAGLLPLLAGSLGGGLDPGPVLGDRALVLVMSGHTFNGLSHPNTPLLEAYAGETLHFAVTVPAISEPHVFHIHGHPWLDTSTGRFIDAKLLKAGDTHTFEVSAGGDGGNVGDWMYHCHMDEHFAAGMWGILRVHPVPE